MINTLQTQKEMLVCVTNHKSRLFIEKQLNEVQLYWINDVRA